jgi:hypothetical protein
MDPITNSTTPTAAATAPAKETDKLPETPSPVSPEVSPQERIVLYVIAALGTGAVLLAYFIWASFHNFPSPKVGTHSGTIVYDGSIFPVDVVCDCPSALTQSIPRQMNFDVTITGSYARGSTQEDEIDVAFSAGNSQVDYKSVPINAAVLSSGQKFTQSLPITITPKDVALTSVILQFSSKKQGSLGSVQWPIESRSGAWSLTSPFVYSGMVMLTVLRFFL